MTRSAILRLLATTVLGAGLSAQAALAQNAPATPASGDDLLGEVVVTATRQTSTVNRVPLSISAVTQKALEAQGIKNVDDLSRTVPGMTFRKTGGEGNPTITLRGIGGNSSTVGAQTTGIYIDDSALQRRMINGLQTGNGAPFPNLFDLERVEVLRGPQGTLYGDSSEGGTIRFITPTPSLTRYSGQVRADVNMLDGGGTGYEAGVAFGGPIVPDKLGFRVSFDNRRDGGYVDAKSMYDGHTFAKDFNWGTSNSFRGSLKWQIDDSFSIMPAVYYGRDYSRGGDSLWGPSPEFRFSGATVLNGVGGCNVTSRPGAITTYGGLCTAGTIIPASAAPAPARPYWEGPNNNVVYARFPTTRTAAYTQNAMPWYDYTSNGNGFYSADGKTAQFVPSPRTTKLFLPSITVDKDFGFFSVKSITTYVNDKTDGLTFSGGGLGGRNVSRYMFGTANCVDGYNTPRDPVTGNRSTAANAACYGAPSYVPGFGDYVDWYNYLNHRNAMSEEVRFSSRSDARLTWVAGAYGSSSRIHMHGLEQNNENQVSLYYRGIPEAWGIGNYPLPVNGVGSPQPYNNTTAAYTGANGLSGPNTVHDAYADVSDRNVRLKEKTWAIFGEANFNITDKLKITGGFRYNDYLQEFSQVYGGVVPASPPPGTSPFNVNGFDPQLAAGSPGTSQANPITNPADVRPFAWNLAGCPTAINCPMQYTSLKDHEKNWTPKAGVSYNFTDTNLVYFTYSKGFRPGGVNPPVSPAQCATDFTNLGITSTPLTYAQDSVTSYEVGNKARILGGKLQVNTSAFWINWDNMQFNHSLGCGLAYVENAGKVVSKGAEVQANGRFGDFSLGANIGYNKAAYAIDVRNPTQPNGQPGTLTFAKGDNIGVPDWTISLNGEYDYRVLDNPGFIRLDYNYTGLFQRGTKSTAAPAYNAATWKGPSFATVNARVGLTFRKIDWSVYVLNLTDAHPLIGYSAGITATGDNGRATGNSIRPRMVGAQANYRF